MELNQILKDLPVLFGAVLVAVLFIQSGLDKAFDWRGNLDFLTSHFSKTPLKGTVAPMMATITLLELATGILSVAGILYFLIAGSTNLIFWAAAVGSATIIALFFGQRVAKDYAGAAILIPYFILLLFLTYISNPYTRP